MEENKFKEELINIANELNIVINNKNADIFYKFMNLLLEWNKKINLTAITEPKEIIIKHFIDSLTINKYIENYSSIIDIGTGAGFPGIPLKIINKDIEIVLVDALNKRINFLNEVIESNNLNKIKAIHSRAEDIGKNKEYREKFDIAVSRAVASMNVLSEYLLPLVKINGICIFMKGSNIEEIEESKKAIDILGGKIIKIDEIIIPSSDIKRNIIVVEKIKNTSSKYPRKSGIPAKTPIA